MTGRPPLDGGEVPETVIGGRYTLRSVLAQGGMATIYRGWDAHLEREVAVKILRPQYGSDPDFVSRFRAEARSAGSLAHPNIVSVHDFGNEDDAQFIVMELVDGRDLAAVLRAEGTLPVDEAVEIAIQAAAGLEAAHRRGIVHRDVKPANILLTHEGHVRVVDFGIARAVAEAGLTATGTTLGSVHYFSPEQARGEEVTAESDVYALGIVLYEMLTGVRPFTGETAAAIALRRLSHPPPPPTEFKPELPASLVAIVMRALELERRDRYPSAGALRAALIEWRTSEPTTRDAPAAGAIPALAAGAVGAVGATDVAAAAADVPAAATPDLDSSPTLEPVVSPAPLPQTAVPDASPPAVASDAGEPTVFQPPPDLPPTADEPLGSPALAAAAAAPVRGTRLRDGRPVRRVEDRTPPPWLWAALIVVGLAFLAGIGFFGGQLLAQSGDPGPSATATGLTANNDAVRIPELVGMTEDAARDALAELGLEVGEVDRPFSDEPSGVVIDTTPGVGETLARGESVDLTVSDGPGPTDSAEPTEASTDPPSVTAPPPAATRPPLVTPEPDPDPDTPAMDAAETVVHWYGLVADGEFDSAYALWSPQMKNNWPRQIHLDDRWRNTDQVIVHANSITYQEPGFANVYVRFTEIKDDGTQLVFEGHWDLVLGSSGWLLNAPYF